MTKDNHITVLACLNIARGTLVLLLGILGFGVLTGIGAVTGDPTAFGILGFIGTAALLFLGMLAIPSIIAGIGLLQRRQWGRILALVVGILSLIDIPIGTALGVYALWLLMDDETKKLFEPRAQEQTMPAPSGSSV